MDKQGPVFRDTAGRQITVDLVGEERIAITQQFTLVASSFLIFDRAEAVRIAEEILRLAR